VKGLLLKELLIAKSYVRMLVLFIVAYAIIGGVTHNGSFLSSLMMVLVLVISVNTISYDDYYHWDHYVLTMPVSRQMIVQSKYLLSFSLVVVMFSISTLFAVLVESNFTDAMLSNFLVAIVALAMIDVMLPCMLKWGPQKGRMVMVLGCGVVGALSAMVVVSAKYGDIVGDIAHFLHVNSELLTLPIMMSVLFAVIAVGTYVSYCVSLRVYLRKEF